MRRNRRPVRGQALVELVVVLPAFIGVGVLLFALLTPSLAPLLLRERAFLEVRGVDPGTAGGELAESHRLDRIPPFPGEGEWSCSLREERAAGLPLLLHRRLFPGTARQAEAEIPLQPLFGRSPLPGALAAPPDDRCRLDLLLLDSPPIAPSRVRQEVARMFLGGALEASGLGKALERIGMDPVRVDLDAIPGKAP